MKSEVEIKEDVKMAMAREVSCTKVTMSGDTFPRLQSAD
jgi:hypothetical protein